MSTSCLIGTFWEVKYDLPYSDPIIFHFISNEYVKTNSGTRFSWRLLPANKIEIYIPEYVSLYGEYKDNRIIGYKAVSEYSGMEWSWTCAPYYPDSSPLISDIPESQLLNGKWTIKNDIKLPDNVITFSDGGSLSSSIYGKGAWCISNQTLIIRTANEFITYKFKIVNNKWTGSARNEMGDEWESNFLHSIIIPSIRYPEEKHKDELKTLYTNIKEDASKISDFLKEIGITCFYHFTDSANVSSIKSNKGLYSWFYCKKNNITIPKPGGDEMSRSLDMRFELHDYVRLSFCKNHPMMYVCQKTQRISTPVIMEISIEVANFLTTLFSDINAADKSHRVGDNLQFIKSLNFVIFNRHYFDLSELEKKQYQAEILVKTHIPSKYIINLHKL